MLNVNEMCFWGAKSDLWTTMSFLITSLLDCRCYGGSVHSFSSVARSKFCEQQKIVRNNNFLVVYKIMGLATLML